MKGFFILNIIAEKYYLSKSVRRNQCLIVVILPATKKKKYAN